MRKTIIIAISAAVGLIATAAAMTRPLELGSEIKATKPYSSGTLTWLLFTAYEATLWTDAPQWSMKAPFALTLTYRMSFSTDELVERTIEELARVAPATPRDALTRYAAALTRAFPSVKDGDRITALHVPGQAVRFFHNGSPTMEIAEPAFAESFFGIWLSPRTAEPKLRARLLRLSN
jgi:hypothetical protein